MQNTKDLENNIKSKLYSDAKKVYVSDCKTVRDKSSLLLVIHKLKGKIETLIGTNKFEEVIFFVW